MTENTKDDNNDNKDNDIQMMNTDNNNKNDKNDNTNKNKEKIVYKGREPKLFMVLNTKFNPAAYDEPDEFYEADGADVNLILKSIRKYDRSSHVKEESSKKLANYPYTIIRIRLPSSLHYEDENIPNMVNTNEIANNNEQVNINENINPNENENINKNEDTNKNENKNENENENTNDNKNPNENKNTNENENENENENSNKEKNKIEQMFLQGNFLIDETIGNVREFVNEHIKNITNNVYILFVSPPKKILKENQTLLELQLVPRAIINLKLKKTIQLTKHCYQ